MTRRALLLLWLNACLCAFATPQVVNVTARRRAPWWHGLVDITVTLTGASNDVVYAGYTFVATNNVTHAALSVTHVTAVDGAIGSGNTWTRKFIWDAKADVGVVKIGDIVFAVTVKEIPLGGVQLWENGPYWAECNVGATKPEEYGYYFWWGDTVGYKRNASNSGWISVRNGAPFTFSSGNCPTYGKTTAQLRSEGYIDSTGNLVAAHDAATAYLGAPWRMPTDAEFLALFSNCDTEWTTRNGVNGRLVTGRGAYSSRSIFLPAAGSGQDSDLLLPGLFGDYWSSSPDSNDSRGAWGFGIGSGGFMRLDTSRCCGKPVCPLRGLPQ